MKDRVQEIAELRKELRERAEEIWGIREDEMIEKRDKALDAYTAACEKFVKARGEYITDLEKEIAELKEQYEKAWREFEFGGWNTKAECHERLKNKNIAWIAYNNAVYKKNDMLKRTDRKEELWKFERWLSVQAEQYAKAMDALDVWENEAEYNERVNNYNKAWRAYRAALEICHGIRFGRVYFDEDE